MYDNDWGVRMKGPAEGEHSSGYAPAFGKRRSALALGEETLLSCPRCDLRARAQPQLAHDVDTVRIHGTLGEDKLVCYLPVGQSTCYQPDDLPLSPGQGGYLPAGSWALAS